MFNGKIRKIVSKLSGFPLSSGALKFEMGVYVLWKVFLFSNLACYTIIDNSLIFYWFFVK